MTRVVTDTRKTTTRRRTANEGELGWRRGRCRAAVGQRQPPGQQISCLVRCLAVERHHGGWTAVAALQLRAPPIADRRHFNRVRASADCLLEAMTFHVCMRPGESGFYASATGDQAKRGAKFDAQSANRPDPAGNRTENIFAVRLSTRFELIIHRISTIATIEPGKAMAALATDRPDRTIHGYGFMMRFARVLSVKAMRQRVRKR